MLTDDTLDQLARLEGWSLDGVIAVFRPAEPGWCARVDHWFNVDDHGHFGGGAGDVGQ